MQDHNKPAPDFAIGRSLGVALAALAATAACTNPTPNATPMLSEEPAWSVAGSNTLGICLGVSVVVTDIDGDGRRDLVASIPSCSGNPNPGGRIAVYRGTAEEAYFTRNPQVFDLQWPDGTVAPAGRALSVVAGDVNGDGRSDLVARSSSGVQVFLNQGNLSATFSAPLFVLNSTASNTRYSTARLADVDGDGKEDLALIRRGQASVYRATPGSTEGAFTFGRDLGAAVALLTPGDVDGDGAADLFVSATASSRFYYGCRDGSPRDCSSGLTTNAAWTVPRSVIATLPDQNGDRLPEVFLGDGGFGSRGRLWLHTSDVAAGGITPTPQWTALGDPLFFDFGFSITFPGDMNRDQRATEFVVGARGRLYAYFPTESGISAELRPDWAWPRSDAGRSIFAGGEEILSGESVAIAPAGDLNGDGYTDLVVAVQPLFGEEGVGQIYVLRGGQIPPPRPNLPPPYLPEPVACGLETRGDKPDLTVDRDALVRSLYVDRKSFADDSCEIAEGCVMAPGERRLLRFTASLPNLGGGPAIIPSPETRPDLFELDECHGHYHLENFSSYELRRPTEELVLAGRKQGYFVVDIQPYCTDSPPASLPFDDGQLLSPGWADIYPSNLPCQWIDITELQDGNYTLRVTIDKNNIIDESDIYPNEVEVPVRIAGDSVTVQ